MYICSYNLPGGEFKYRVDLFPRDVELLDDFLDAGSGFKIFKHG